MHFSFFIPVWALVLLVIPALIFLGSLLFLGWLAFDFLRRFWSDR